ncbi:MAG TPA: phosphoribosyltransferase family protein [Candidatus Acidoferrales bacterium]|jgi:putative phosphoribosyl transferase|nr:phosphoribosyltransferase family protein [Candidatus Acidoferrales bacterium]
MIFASRQEAGERLGEFLRQRGVEADLVLGLPRGGVVVAARVAHELKLPLDVLVVRKIGHPFQPEFAVGALAEPDCVFLNDETLAEYPISRGKLDKIIAEEKERLNDYGQRFHLHEIPSLEGKGVLIVDDGLATGATAEVAALSARKQHARRVIVAAPVASINAVELLRRVADEVEVLSEEADFQAVGQFYDEFSPTGDDEVISLLRQASEIEILRD